jgi:hypothetical protein
MLILNFTYPLRCLRVPPGVCVPPVEYHSFRRQLSTRLHSDPQWNTTPATIRSGYLSLTIGGEVAA